LEPSLAAFVITTTYLVYVLHCNNIQKHIPLHFHLIVLYLIYSINSGFGYLLYLIVVSYLNLKWIKKHVLPSIVIGIAVIVLTSQYGVEHYRLGGFVNYLISFDYTYLDNNAAIRVRPLTDYLYTFTNLNIHHWIGHGLGSSTSYFYSLYYYLTNAPTFSAFFAEMIYDLGIIGIILFFVFIYANAEKKHLLITCSIIALLCFNAGINTQVFWWVIILLFSLKIMNSSPLSNDGHASLTKI